jgi:hypothetical protein
LLEGWRKQLSPNRSPQVDLNISPIDRALTNTAMEKR